MELRLEREPTGARCTLGKLWRLAGGKRIFLCDTLEDVVRQPADWKPSDPVLPWKTPGETAIPALRYRVTVTRSERFGRDLPLLNAVPGFSGVRIHPGNTADDTEGCILVGRRMGPSTILESREHFKEVFATIDEALMAGDEVWLEIVNAGAE